MKTAHASHEGIDLEQGDPVSEFRNYVEFLWPDCDRWIALTQVTKWDRFQDRFYFPPILSY